MSLSSTVLIDDLESDHTQYAVHVKYKDRWMCATYLDSLRDAELVAEAAHRRSGLPVEIRTMDCELVMAFEPAARNLPVSTSALQSRNRQASTS